MTDDLLKITIDDLLDRQAALWKYLPPLNPLHNQLNPLTLRLA